ncbi:MAG: hypothetical protein Q4F52_10935 [Bacteroidaceae bacterium]|nr:hypothetical protein [Bacteroidaceae bacterium]
MGDCFHKQDWDGKATITLYNNARTTQISVDAEGQVADGTLLWKENDERKAESEKKRNTLRWQRQHVA